MTMNQCVGCEGTGRGEPGDYCRECGGTGWVDPNNPEATAKLGSMLHSVLKVSEVGWPETGQVLAGVLTTWLGNLAWVVVEERGIEVKVMAGGTSGRFADQRSNVAH